MQTAITQNITKKDENQGMDPTGNQKVNATEANLGAMITLQEFLATTGGLTLEERQRIVDQALVLIEQFYVHLPLKRAMHAVDPVHA